VLALWSFTIAELYDRSGERVKAEDFYLASLENTLNVIRAREAQNLPLTLKAVRIYARLENEARAGELLDMLAGAQSSPNQTWETSFNVLLGLEDVYRWAWANNSTLLVNKTCAMGRGLAKTLGDQHHLRIYTRCSPPAPEEVCLSSIPVAKELWIDLEAGRLYASLSPTSKSVELVRSLGERVLLLNQSALAEAPAQDRPVLEAVRDVCRQRMASVLQRPFNVSLAAVNGSLVCFASIAGERINGTVVGSTAPPANATAEPRGDPTGAVLRSLLVIVAVFALALALLTYRAPPPASAPRSAREGGERAAGGEAKGRAPVPRAARPPHEGRREARARRAPGLDVEGIDVRLDEEEAEAAGADDERGLPKGL
jgi:hypothetical protein